MKEIDRDSPRHYPAAQGLGERKRTAAERCARGEFEGGLRIQEPRPFPGKEESFQPGLLAIGHVLPR